MYNKLKAEVHRLFDPIWKCGYISRANLYIWLAHALQLEEPDCHISQLSDKQLRDAIDILNRFHTEHYSRMKQSRNDRDKNKTRSNNSTHKRNAKRDKSSRNRGWA